MILPGELFDDIYSLFKYLILIIGITVGSGLTFSLSAYTGKEPLNISVFLGILVGTQLLLLILLVLAILIGIFRRSYLPKSVFYLLIGMILSKAIMALKHAALRNISGKRRVAIEAAVGLISAKTTVYGSLFSLSLFMLAQLFGIGFNIGILIAMLMKVIGSDIAFAWQSAIQFSAKALYELVKLVSLPWSWAVPPDIAHPTLAQIEGSRMILKDGIWHHSTSDLISWWPFMCFVILCYGLLPRLFLCCTAYIVQKWRLNRLKFDHIRILHDSKEERGVILIPDEIFEQCSNDMLDRLIRQHIGNFQIVEKLRIEADSSRFSELKEKIIFILCEAWQPPIKEVLMFIRNLRSIIAHNLRIEILLIGRPRSGMIFTPIKEEEYMVWCQKLGSLADPYLNVERLVRDES